jgi:hypothetical protein
MSGGSGCSLFIKNNKGQEKVLSITGINCHSSPFFSLTFIVAMASQFTHRC